MATYEIFPNTVVTGTQIDQDTEGIPPTVCRQFCDDMEDCQAFVWNATEKCALLSDISSHKSVQGSETYVKKGAPSYWLLWLLIIGLVFILFFNKCRK